MKPIFYDGWIIYGMFVIGILIHLGRSRNDNLFYGFASLFGLIIGWYIIDKYKSNWIKKYVEFIKR